MLPLKRISDLLRISAENIESAAGTVSAEQAKMIRELRDMTREILTSQEYQNLKIKF
jgi:hypothetical protein